jgi:hypothetical protein
VDNDLSRLTHWTFDRPGCWETTAGHLTFSHDKEAGCQMYAVENGGDGTNINLAANKTGIRSGAAGAKIVELSLSNLLVTYPPLRQ